MRSLLVCALASALLTVPAWADNPGSMDKWPYKIVLSEGSNAPVQIGTLSIDPVNLFIQEKPWDDSSPHVQMQLTVTEGKSHRETFLWYYEPGDEQHTNNFPKAFGNYILGLDIGESDVTLTADTLGHGDTFVLDLGQTATIGSLTIKYDTYALEEYTDLYGNYDGYSVSYLLILCAGGRLKQIEVEYTEENGDEIRVSEALGYTVEILYNSPEFLKLRVHK